MSDPFGEWPAPEMVSPEEERQYLLDVIKTGIRFMIFSIMGMTVFLWVAANILSKSGIIGGSISWTNCGILAFSAVLIRLWNSTFFK